MQVKTSTAKQTSGKNTQSRKQYESDWLGDTLHRFQAAIRAFRFRNGSSDCNGEQGNMCNAVEILCCLHAVHPEPFLTGILETGIITLDFSPHGINLFECDTFSVDGKSVVVRQGHIFRTAAVFLAVVPILVIAGTNAGFRAFERTAILLPCPTAV